MSEKEAILDRADDPDVDQLHYDISGLLGTWYAYLSLTPQTSQTPSRKATPFIARLTFNWRMRLPELIFPRERIRRTPRQSISGMDGDPGSGCFLRSSISHRGNRRSRDKSSRQSKGRP